MREKKSAGPQAGPLMHSAEHHEPTQGTESVLNALGRGTKFDPVRGSATIIIGGRYSGYGEVGLIGLSLHRGASARANRACAGMGLASIASNLARPPVRWML